MNFSLSGQARCQYLKSKIMEDFRKFKVANKCRFVNTNGRTEAMLM